MSSNSKRLNGHPRRLNRSQPILQFRSAPIGVDAAVYARHGGALSVQNDEWIAYPDVISACRCVLLTQRDQFRSQLSSRAVWLLLNLSSQWTNSPVPTRPTREMRIHHRRSLSLLEGDSHE